MAPRALVVPGLMALASGVAAVVLAACGGGGGGGSVLPPPQPSPSPTGGGGGQYACAWPDIRPLDHVRRVGQFVLHPVYRPSHESDIVPGYVAVRIPSGDLRALGAAASRVGGRISAGFNRFGSATIALPRGADPVHAADMLRGIAGVVAAGPVIERHLESPFIPNNLDFGSIPYDAPNPGVNNPNIQWDMYQIFMPQAWSQPTFLGSSSIKIAMIDTGYDTSNPDLAGQVVASIVFDLGTGQQDVGAPIEDKDGHGTDTSGIADAATNQGGDVAGTTGGVKLLEARVFPEPTNAHPNPGASTADVAAAINWAVGSGANVISMSLGSGTPDNINEEPAVAFAISSGVVVVAAAGNSDLNSLDYPAADPNVIAVGATSLCDSPAARDWSGPGSGPAFEYMASYSNWVPSPASNVYYVVAPGGDPSPMQSPGCQTLACLDFLQWITNLYTNHPLKPPPGNVALFAGTSMATPHVAGIAALMLSKDPSLTPAQVDSIISTSTDVLPDPSNTSIPDPRSGHGRVNANTALNDTP